MRSKFQMDLISKLEFFSSEWTEERFGQWIRRLRDIFVMQPNFNDNQKLSCLRISGGSELIDILDNQADASVEDLRKEIPVEADRALEFEKAIAKVKVYLRGSSNPILERKKLYVMLQHPTEKLSDYVSRVRCQARKCVGVTQEEEITLEIVATGAREKDIRRGIIKKKITTLTELQKEGALNETLNERDFPQAYTPLNVVTPVDQSVSGRESDGMSESSVHWLGNNGSKSNPRSNFG